VKPAGLLTRETWWGYLLLAPALLVIALVAIYPLGYTLWLSCQQQILKLPWLRQGWVGLANYRELFTAARFWQALAHTVLFTVVSVALELVLGLLAALAIHRARILTGLTRAAVLLPWAIPTVVAAVIWLFLVNPAFGLIPLALSFLGASEASRVLLAHPVSAWAVIIATDAWKNTPFMTLMLLAGLQVIPADLYEAAAMDGASGWQAFRRITLPLLKPAILVALIFRTAQAFMVFDHIYALTGGGPGTATETLAFLNYQAILNDMRFGYGSALSVLIFLGSLAFALLYLRTLGLPGEGGPAS
jgi:multiple sugar transport system permease protein